MAVTTPTAPIDERVASTGLVRKLLAKPELGAVVGAVVVFVFFAAQSGVFWSASGIANWLDVATTYGIMAVSVGLLMIGGEFDLSAGVMTASTGLLVAICSGFYGWNIWAAIALSFVFALGIGLLNGILVVRTGLPSFIITLGTFLMLQGVNVGGTKLVTNTVLASGVDQASGYGAAKDVFGSTFTVAGTSYHTSILWWFAITAVGSYTLTRTRFGNWTFSVGGDVHAARNIGVPAARTKITLFVLTAVSAWFVGTMEAVRFTSIQANAGVGEELIYIVAAVIGGCLLTGGYGSVIGATVGALIFGMTSQGIVYVGWDADWFKFFLGAMLLLAVLANRLVRRYAEQTRR